MEMKVLLSAKEMNEIVAAESMSIGDFMAIVDVWTPVLNHYHGVLVGTYTFKQLIGELSQSQPNPRVVVKIAKKLQRILEAKGLLESSLFNPSYIFTVTCDGVIAFPVALQGFNAHHAYELSPEFKMRMQATEGAANIDTLMDMVFRSRVYGTRNITAIRIGCDCPVHALGAELLNELNPIMDKVVDDLNDAQALMTLIEAGKVKMTVVG